MELTREMKRAALAPIRQDDIRGPYADVWGTGMGHLFAIAHTLYEVDEVPYEWHFSPGMMQTSVEDIIACGNETNHNDGSDESCDCDYTQIPYVSFLDAGESGAEMLTYAGNVINRYLNFAKRAGRDY